MKNEELDLLKILCRYLPYGLVCRTEYGDYNLIGIDLGAFGPRARLDSPVYDEDDDWYDLTQIKPCLRLKSDMTSEEIKTYHECCEFDDCDLTGEPLYLNNSESYAYLDSIHVDYENLIPRGLAVHAGENMYHRPHIPI